MIREDDLNLWTQKFYNTAIKSSNVVGKMKKLLKEFDEL